MLFAEQYYKLSCNLQQTAQVEYNSVPVLISTIFI